MHYPFNVRLFFTISLTGLLRLRPSQVLYYLVRVEPFTTLSIQLQGGKFDHADRMFSDIESTWNGVLEDMSDLKELVLKSLPINTSIWKYLLIIFSDLFLKMV